APLYFFGACAKVTVTGCQVTPGVDDRDDGLALKIVKRVAHLFGPRTVSKRAQIIFAKPAMAAKLFWTLFHDLGLLRRFSAALRWISLVIYHLTFLISV